MIHGCLALFDILFPKIVVQVVSPCICTILKQTVQKDTSPSDNSVGIKFNLLKEASLWLCGSSLVENVKQCSKWRKNYALQR